MKAAKSSIVLLLSSVTLLFLTSVVRGVELNLKQNSSLNKQVHSESVRRARQFCGNREMRVEGYFETKNFFIHLCYDSNNEIWYYGIAKGSEAEAIGPLYTYTEEGTGYVVENGDYTYIVTGLSLSIYEGNNLLQEEPVINSHHRE
ncbi:hypothetical protein JJD41_23880 [Oxynema sp. CENA135]|nr:hypothetical protein [Oxynema sp. CENA135]